MTLASSEVVSPGSKGPELPPQYHGMVRVLTEFFHKPENYTVLAQSNINLENVTGLLQRFAASDTLTDWNAERKILRLSPCRLGADFTPLKIQSFLLGRMRENLPNFRDFLVKLKSGMPTREFTMALASAAPGMAFIKPDGLEHLTPEQIAIMVMAPVLLGVCSPENYGEPMHPGSDLGGQKEWARAKLKEVKSGHQDFKK